VVAGPRSLVAPRSRGTTGDDGGRRGTAPAKHSSRQNIAVPSNPRQRRESVEVSGALRREGLLVSGRALRAPPPIPRSFVRSFCRSFRLCPRQTRELARSSTRRRLSVNRRARLQRPHEFQRRFRGRPASGGATRAECRARSSLFFFPDITVKGISSGRWNGTGHPGTQIATRETPARR